MCVCVCACVCVYVCVCEEGGGKGMFGCTCTTRYGVMMACRLEDDVMHTMMMSCALLGNVPNVL